MLIRVEMIKTACGPDFSLNSGTIQSIDADLAKAWCNCSDPICKIIKDDTDKEEKKEPVIEENITSNNQNKVETFTDKAQSKPVKYRPGAK